MRALSTVDMGSRVPTCSHLYLEIPWNFGGDQSKLSGLFLCPPGQGDLVRKLPAPESGVSGSLLGVLAARLPPPTHAGPRRRLRWKRARGSASAAHRLRTRDRGFSRHRHRPLLVPGGPTHLVHRLRLETIWKFTHKMKPRLVLAQRFLGRKNNNKQKKFPFQTSQEQTGALPSSHSVTPRSSWGLSAAATPCS